MVAILGLLLVDGLQRTFGFALLARESAEEILIHLAQVWEHTILFWLMSLTVVV